MREVIITNFKKFNLGLALRIALKFFTSMAKQLKVKVRKFWELIPPFVEVTGEKLVGETFCPSILNRVKSFGDDESPSRVRSKYSALCGWLFQFCARLSLLLACYSAIKVLFPATRRYNSSSSYEYCRCS